MLMQKKCFSSKNKKMNRHLLIILLLSELFKIVVLAETWSALPLFQQRKRFVFIHESKRPDEAARYVPGNTKNTFPSPVIKQRNTYSAPALTGFLPPHNHRNIFLTFKTKFYV